ncbi:MAG: TolC family protein [Bdellovibrionales bacterium]|nr:TolC family protein [Bdellovibrionales bacterium]
MITINRLFKLMVLTSLFNLNSFALTLDEYLNLVRQNNLSYQSFKLQKESAEGLINESELIFSPQIFANANIGHDKKLSSPPMLIFDDTKTSNYSVGLAKQFEFGLETKLYYQLGQTDFVGATFSNGAPNAYWDASPKVELKLPLLANGFGRAARANSEVITQQNLSQKYANQAQMDNLLVLSESAYWRLVAARESVSIQKQALSAAESILEYVAKKEKMNLGDNADVLQAKALVENANLQLLQAENEEKVAIRNFNKYLNIDLSAKVSKLESYNYDLIQQAEIPKNRPGDRFDIKAAESQALLSNASAKIQKEKNLATLDLYGNYALNGRNEALNEALQNTDQSQRDTAFIGVKFSMPLNFSANEKARLGAEQAMKSAELNRKYKIYEQEQDWYNLTEKFEEAKKTLSLALKMEEAQKNKLKNERQRLHQGRTTTYQVLLFEQEYSQAQAAKIQAASIVLALQSQTKLYQASSKGDN